MLKTDKVSFRLAAHKFDRKASLSLSFDDLTAFDLKLEKYLKKYNLKSSVFLNTSLFCKFRKFLGNILFRQWLDISRSGSIDYSSHSLRHLPFYKMKRANLEASFEEELRKSRNLLNLFFKKKCIGYAYPYGEVYLNKLVGKYYLFGRSTSLEGIEYLNLSSDLSVIGVTLNPLEEIFKNNQENEISRVLDEAVKNGGWVRLYGHLKEINRLNYWDKLESLFDAISKRDEVYCGSYEDVSSQLCLIRNLKIVEIDNADEDCICELKIIYSHVSRDIYFDNRYLTVIMESDKDIETGFKVYVDSKEVTVFSEGINRLKFWFGINCTNSSIIIKKNSNLPIASFSSFPGILEFSIKKNCLHARLNRPADITVYYKFGKSEEFLLLTRNTSKQLNHDITIPFLDYENSTIVARRFNFCLAFTDKDGKTLWLDKDAKGNKFEIDNRNLMSIFEIRQTQYNMIGATIFKLFIYLRGRFGAKKLLILLFLLALILFAVSTFVL